MRRDFLPITMVTLIWAWPPIFIKLLQQAGFEPLALNFYRYLAASLFFLFYTAYSAPGELRRALGAWPRLVIPALVIAVFQIVWVVALYKVMPTMAGLIGRVSVLMSLVLSYLFFAEERKAMRSWSFLLGAGGSLLGVAGVILFAPGLSWQTPETAGFLLLFLSSLLWALYSVAVKKFLVGMSSLASFSLVGALATLFLLAPTLIWGEAGHVLRATPLMLLILVGSGILCVGLTQVLYYRSIAVIGLSYSTTVPLASPLMTGVFSYLLLGEMLTLFQWVAGTVLLAALAVLIWGRGRELLAEAPS